MPSAPPSFCSRHGLCHTHATHVHNERAKERRQEIVRTRDPSLHAFYNSGRWKAYRKTHIERSPLCVMCEREGRAVLGSIVDHIIPHRGDVSLFWAMDGVQTLCVRHDSLKRLRENGLLGCNNHGTWTAFVESHTVCRDCGRDVS
jgi:5-methylcytosine-specific restriction enzyme A